MDPIEKLNQLLGQLQELTNIRSMIIRHTYQELTKDEETTAKRNAFMEKYNPSSQAEVVKFESSDEAVHKAHCCVDHGCKYADEECPVVNKQCQQKYKCQDC